MSLTLQRTQNRLAWKAKNRSFCSEDRRLSLQTICTMRINCRWPIHLFRSLWQKWKCYCNWLHAESSFQVVESSKESGASILLFVWKSICQKFWWSDSLSLASHPLSQQLRFKMCDWCAHTKSYNGLLTFTSSIHSICCKSVTFLWLKLHFMM